MATAANLVEVCEGGIDRLDPAPRGFKDLTAERRKGDRNRDRRRSLAGRTCCGLGASCFPVPPGGRGAAALQPVQRDVVDDVFRGQIAHGLAVDERAGDLVVAVRVVVEYPCRQTYGCIQQGVADRLRPSGLLQEVAEAIRHERVDRVVRRAFLLGLLRQSVHESDCSDEQVYVDAEQPLGCLAAHRIRDSGSHIAPLGDVAYVAEAVHQLSPRARDAARLPAELGRLT